MLAPARASTAARKTAPPSTRGPTIRARASALLLCAALSACTPGGPTGPDPSGSATGQDQPTDQPAAQDGPVLTRTPQEQSTLAADDDPAALALAASAALYERSEVVLVAGAGDGPAQQRAAELAEGAGVPVLLTGDATAAELERLGATTVLAVGEPATTWAEGLPGAERPDVVEVGEGAPDELEDLPDPEPRPGVTVLTTGDPAHLAATATARAAGAVVQAVPTADVRSDPALVTALGEGGGEHVVALGTAFGPPERLAARVASAATGVQLPGGGQRLWPGRRMVALYGSPITPSLGALGEQPLEATLQRARDVAAEYEGLTGTDDVPVVPTLEIITTVASASPGVDGDYSNEATIEELRPWVDAAEEAGIYVVLDLQPGRTDFLTQARRYEELLARPHVGLALDPEWRLGPGQVHLRQIGSVSIDEVNTVVTWLGDLTRDRALPQKVLLLHQFRLSMLQGRERLDTSRDELAIVLHADGNGPPSVKADSYRALSASPPPGIVWGWKNFYDEDTPTFTPQQTLDVEPEPVFVSYQ